MRVAIAFHAALRAVVDPEATAKNELLRLLATVCAEGPRRAFALFIGVAIVHVRVLAIVSETIVITVDHEMHLHQLVFKPLREVVGQVECRHRAHQSKWSRANVVVEEVLEVILEGERRFLYCLEQAREGEHC